MASPISIDATNNQDIDGVLSGLAWDTRNLTYSFPTGASFYESGYGLGEPGKNFQPLAAAQVAVARQVFQMVSSVTNLTFAELEETASDHADLRLARAEISAPAWTYFPEADPVGGDSWFRASVDWFNNPTPGTYAYYVFIHEIAHALGLKHGNDAGSFGAMTAVHDSMEYSVTTYRSYVGAEGRYVENESWGYAQSLMMYDIAALQHMYGANYSSNSGNTVYRWNPETGQAFIDGVGQVPPAGNRIFMTVWDGGGDDTYDFSNYTSNLGIDLRPGEWSHTSLEQIALLGASTLARGNIANALLHQGDTRSLIENAIGGSGDDHLTGNLAANVLRGGKGVDTIEGLEGDDILSGGVGRDVLSGGSGKDSFVFDARPTKSANRDRIIDFVAVDDTIYLENAVFTKIGKSGHLASKAYWSGPKAHDASDRIIYHKKAGALYYDPDGTGMKDQVQFAQLNKGMKLTVADFIVI